MKRRASFAETVKSMSHYTSTSVLGSFCVKYTRGNQLSKEGMYQRGIKYDGLIDVYEKGGPSTPLWGFVQCLCCIPCVIIYTVLVYRCDFCVEIFLFHICASTDFFKDLISEGAYIIKRTVLKCAYDSLVDLM